MSTRISLNARTSDPRPSENVPRETLSYARIDNAFTRMHGARGTRILRDALDNVGKSALRRDDESLYAASERLDSSSLRRNESWPIRGRTFGFTEPSDEPDERKLRKAMEEFFKNFRQLVQASLPQGSEGLADWFMEDLLRDFYRWVQDQMRKEAGFLALGLSEGLKDGIEAFGRSLPIASLQSDGVLVAANGNWVPGGEETSVSRWRTGTYSVGTPNTGDSFFVMAWAPDGTPFKFLGEISEEEALSRAKAMWQQQQTARASPGAELLGDIADGQIMQPLLRAISDPDEISFSKARIDHVLRLSTGKITEIDLLPSPMSGLDGRVLGWPPSPPDSFVEFSPALIAPTGESLVPLLESENSLPSFARGRRNKDPRTNVSFTRNPGGDTEVIITIFVPKVDTVGESLIHVSKQWQDHGHVTATIDGTAYSFGPGASSGSRMDIFPSQESVVASYSYWDATGLKLDVSREEADELVRIYMKRAERSHHWAFGDDFPSSNYSFAWNNCGDPVQEWLEGMGYDTGTIVPPADLGSFILQSDLMRPGNFDEYK